MPRGFGGRRPRGYGGRIKSILLAVAALTMFVLVAGAPRGFGS